LSAARGTIENSGCGIGREGAVKFRVEREVLGEAVSWVARALPTRPVVPVLSGLLLNADGGDLRLSCFDYEISASATVPAEIGEKTPRNRRAMGEQRSSRGGVSF